MAGNDPTKDTAPVSLDVCGRGRKFLQELFEMARDGVREELRAHGQRVSSPGLLRRELAAYERLLDGLDRRQLEPHPDLVAILNELAEVVDESNEYRRVVAEHEALHGLIDSLERPRGSCAGRNLPCAAIRCRGECQPSAPES